MVTLYVLLILAGDPVLYPLADYNAQYTCDHVKARMEEYWSNDVFVCAEFEDL